MQNQGRSLSRIAAGEAFRALIRSLSMLRQAVRWVPMRGPAVRRVPMFRELILLLLSANLASALEQPQAPNPVRNPFALHLDAVPAAISISQSYEFVLKPALLDEVRVEWRFNSEYSRKLARDYGLNQDSGIGGDALALLKRSNFENYRRFGYFTTIAVDSKLLQVQPRDFSAAFDDGSLEFRFEIPIELALDSSSHEISIDETDPSGFVSFDEADPSSARVVGALPGIEASVVSDRGDDGDGTRLVLRMRGKQ